MDKANIDMKKLHNWYGFDFQSDYITFEMTTPFTLNDVKKWLKNEYCFSDEEVASGYRVVVGIERVKGAIDKYGYMYSMIDFRDTPFTIYDNRYSDFKRKSHFAEKRKTYGYKVVVIAQENDKLRLPKVSSYDEFARIIIKDEDRNRWWASDYDKSGYNQWKYQQALWDRWYKYRDEKDKIEFLATNHDEEIEEAKKILEMARETIVNSLTVDIDEFGYTEASRVKFLVETYSWMVSDFKDMMKVQSNKRFNSEFESLKARADKF